MKKAIRNNLFSFATSELSQDAFICWCLNWFNDGSKPVLQEMAKKIIFKLTNVKEFVVKKIVSVDIFRQFSRKVKVDNKSIHVKIDVLVIVNNDIAVIIEDKTYSNEHDQQIERYKKGLQEIYKDKQLSKIITVYWKTGVYNDWDKVTVADKKITGEDVKGLLADYVNESEIIKDYFDCLEANLQWQEEHKKYWLPLGVPWWELNIVNYHIAQYTLLREIFPEKRWDISTGRYEGEYEIYMGSSFDRPWTQTVAKWGKFSNDEKKEDWYKLFWRIDSDKNGPYISFRICEWGYSKKKAERHKKLYQKLSLLMAEIVEAMSDKDKLGLREAVKSNNGGYNEAAFFHYHLDFSDWDKNKEMIIQAIREISDKFVERFTREVEPEFLEYKKEHAEKNS